MDKNRIMGKKSTLIALFLGLFILVNGQDADSISYRYRAYGIGTLSQKISFLSPIKYSGISSSLDWGRFSQINKKISTRTTYFNGAATLNNNDQKSEAENPEERPIPPTILSLNYGTIFNRRYEVFNKKLPKKMPSISLGWAYWLDTGFDLKPFNVNNLFYYNLNNMAGLSIGLEKRIHLKKIQLDISNEFTLPILGVYAGTRHSLALPYSSLIDDTNFWDAFRVGSFETNFQFRNNLNLDFTFVRKKTGTKHTIGVQYGINYANLRLNNNNKVQVNHAIKLSYLFNSSRYAHK